MFINSSKPCAIVISRVSRSIAYKQTRIVEDRTLIARDEERAMKKLVPSFVLKFNAERI
ncbi:hypothetical protein TRAPUB_14403 [Trametes pubescens]|uniref:Uncharacterized protein n=1 Tax=Trametes pubescens TaxID=154538 RepID=A0A1M2VNF9_TRAPU|nr:hypothetical protein TRAPUB_14403 [Trametes pubescens]